MEKKVIPQVVKDYIEKRDWEGKVRQFDASSLTFNDLICVPNHTHDLNESNILTHTINLTEVGKVSLLGAPECTFYLKTDPSQPAYVVADWSPGDDTEWWYAEF